MAGYQTYGSSVHGNVTALYESAKPPGCATCARVGTVVSEPSILRQATGILGASTMGAGAVMAGVGAMDYGEAAADGKLGNNITQNTSVAAQSAGRGENFGGGYWHKNGSPPPAPQPVRTDNDSGSPHEKTFRPDQQHGYLTLSAPQPARRDTDAGNEGKFPHEREASPEQHSGYTAMSGQQPPSYGRDGGDASRLPRDREEPQNRHGYDTRDGSQDQRGGYEPISAQQPARRGDDSSDSGKFYGDRDNRSDRPGDYAYSSRSDDSFARLRVGQNSSVSIYGGN